MVDGPRALFWMGGSLKDLRSFPDEVQDVIGFALHLAQVGGKSPAAKPLKGMGSGVLEVIDDHDGNTYRAVYTVRFGSAVYVLHAFQKKSKQGIATPPRDVKMIETRLAAARKHHEEGQ
jgi:phage-related protein